MLTNKRNNVIIWRAAPGRTSAEFAIIPHSSNFVKHFFVFYLVQYFPKIMLDFCCGVWYYNIVRRGIPVNNIERIALKFPYKKIKKCLTNNKNNVIIMM